MLNEALCDKEGAIAATALLALYRNVGADPDLAKEAASGALFLVRNDETSTAVRMTALQVGAELCAKKVASAVPADNASAADTAAATFGASPNDLRPAAKVELLAIARKLAKDGKTPTVLRISAIAAIGTLGDTTDRPMLDEMAKGVEHRLHAAATTALKKL